MLASLQQGFQILGTGDGKLPHWRPHRQAPRTPTRPGASSGRPAHARCNFKLSGELHLGTVPNFQPKVQSHPWICRVLQAAIISRWPATSTPVGTRSDAEDAGFTPDSRRMLAFQLISAL